MKIAIFSDLHMEFGQSVSIDCEGADVIVLAGDCEARKASIEFASQLRRRYRVPVLVVAGNHEFYGADYHDMLPSLRTLAKKRSVNFLEKDCVTMGDVRFIGCTLWTNFCLHGDEKQNAFMEVAENRIRDFTAIKINGAQFKPHHAAALFQESYQWLEEELNKPFGGKTVVVTHFAPHIVAKHPKYPPDDPFRPYFVSDCAPLMRSHDIDLWIYGHTHFSLDCIVEQKTRLVSNQLGYPGEDDRYTRFDPIKICEI